MVAKPKPVKILSALKLEEKMEMSFCLVRESAFKAIDMNDEVDREFSQIVYALQ
jgi:hypothetical protein